MPAFDEPVKVKFGDAEEAARQQYVYDHIDAIKRSLTTLVETKLPKWRKYYEGKPETPEKTFPWRGASNIVVQLIATNVETLQAQVMASIYEVPPIWTAELVGDWDKEAFAEEQRSIIERFMGMMAYEPSELDLYRVESVWFSSAIKYGFSALKGPYTTNTEDMAIGIGDNGPVFKSVHKHYGPRPEVVSFEDFGVDPRSTTLDGANFKYHIARLKRYDLLERKFLGHYDKAALDEVLKSPDRYGASQVEQQQLESIGAANSNSHIDEEWDIYECHYTYLVRIEGQERKLSIIESYHYKTKTSLRAVYNWYPENMNIFTGARLGYSDRGLFELGYCEMLEQAQKETSAEHNRYADNGTLANTSIFRIDPDLSTRLDAAFSIFPTAMIPARAGEFEVMNVGRQTDTGIDRERQNLSLVSQRTGLDSGMSAAGGGIVNPKRGIYSAMGTFSAMQAGNRRSNLRQSDFKNAHIELGRKMLKLYAEFGINPERMKQFGNDSKWLRTALDNIKSGRINIPMKGSTASINREMEKQNDMLMVNIMRQHYQGIGGILQNLGQAPKELQEYLVNVCIASDYLMRHFLRNFGYEDVSRILPEPAFIKQLKEQQLNGATGQSAGTPGGTGGSGENVPEQPVQQNYIPTQGASNSGLPASGQHIPV